MTKNNYRSKKDARRIRYAKSGITGAQGIQGAEGSKGVESGIKGSKAGEWHNGFWYQYDEETGRKVHWVPKGGGKAVPCYLDEVLEKEREAQEQGIAADYGVDQEKWNKANEAIKRLEQNGVDITKITENPATHTYSIQWRDGKSFVGNDGLSIDGVLQCIHDLDKKFSTSETDAAEKSEKPETQTRPRVDESQENDKAESNQDEKEPEPIKLTSRGDWTPRKDAPSAEDVALCRRVANNLNHGWADALRKIASVQDDKKRRALFERAVNNAFDIYRRAFVCHGDGGALAEMIGREVEASEQGARKALDNYLTLYDIGPREMLKYAPGLENLYNAHKDDDFSEGLENYNEPGDGKDEEETKDVDAGDEEARETEPTNETPEDAARSFIQDESNVPDETQTEPQSADDRQITIDGITDSIKAFKKKAASLRGRADDLNRLVEVKKDYKEDASLQKQFAEKLIKQADDLEKKIDDAVAQLSTEETEREEADAQGINESAEGETSPGEDAARAISRSVAQNDEDDDLQDELDGAREDVEPDLSERSNETNETLNEEIENESSETTEPQAGTEELEEESASGEEPRAGLESGADNEEIADETANGDGRTEADLEGEQEAEDVADDGMTPEQAAQAIGKIADEEQDEENAQTSKPSITNSREPKPGIITGRPNTEDIDESQVYRVNISDLNLDPSRFQFKLDVDRQTGASSEYEGAKFNPKLAGKIMVWRDPADGKDYVVNGHHRYDMALKSGYTGDVDVKYITAPTPDDAKVQGAIENIADGKGTSTDCAEIMKSSSKEEIEKLLRDSGVSPRNAIMREGLLLANLDPTIFRDVKLGKISASLAAVLGKLLPNDHDRQRALYQKFIEPRLDAQGTNGKNKPLTADDVAAYALAYVGAQGIKPEGNFLFDAGLDYDSEVDARYELIKRVQKTLRNQKTTNSKMSKQGNVDVLTAGGALTGSIDIDTAKRNQKTAADALTRFTHDVQFKGELNDKFTEIVREYLNAKTADEREQIADRAVESVVNFYNGGERGLIGGPAGTHQDNAVGDAGSNREEGSGERDRELVSSDAQRRISDNAGREDRSSRDGTSVGAVQSAGDVGGRRRPGDDLQSDGNQSQSGRDISEPSGDTGGVDAGTEQTGTEREGRVEPTVDESTEQETNAPQDEEEQETVGVESEQSDESNAKENSQQQNPEYFYQQIVPGLLPTGIDDRFQGAYFASRFPDFGQLIVDLHDTQKKIESVKKAKGRIARKSERELVEKRGSLQDEIKQEYASLRDSETHEQKEERLEAYKTRYAELRAKSDERRREIGFDSWRYSNPYYTRAEYQRLAIERLEEEINAEKDAKEGEQEAIDVKPDASTPEEAAQTIGKIADEEQNNVISSENGGVSTESSLLKRNGLYDNLDELSDDEIANRIVKSEYEHEIMGAFARASREPEQIEESNEVRRQLDEIRAKYPHLDDKINNELAQMRQNGGDYHDRYQEESDSQEQLNVEQTSETKEVSSQTPPTTEEQPQKARLMKGVEIPKAKSDTSRPTGYNKGFFANELGHFADCVLDSYGTISNAGAQFYHDVGLLDDQGNWTDLAKRLAKGLRARSYKEPGILETELEATNSIFENVPVLRWLKDNYKPGTTINLARLKRTLMSKRVGLSEEEAQDAVLTIARLTDCFFNRFRQADPMRSLNEGSMEVLLYPPAPKEEYESEIAKNEKLASETAPNELNSRGMSVKGIYDSNAYNLRLRMQQYYPETSEETQNTDEADQEAIEVEPTNETPEEAAQAVGEIADETPGDEETAAQAVSNSAGAEENAPTTRVDVRTATSALNAISYELNEKYNKARSQSAKSKLRAALAEVSAWTNRLNDPNRSGEYADILDAAKYSFSPSGDKNKVFQKLNSVRQFLDGYDSLFQSGEDADADENVEATTTPDTENIPETPEDAAQAVGAIADGVTDVAGETQNANESTDDLETLFQERKRVRDERDAVLKSGNASRINENTDHLNELTERIKEAENRLIAPLEGKLSELQSEEDPKKRVEGLEAFRREIENLRVESESKGYSPISEIYKYIADKIDKSRTDAKIDELNSRRSSSEPEAAAREVSEQAENAPTPATPEESAQEVGQAAESSEIPGDVAAQETAKIADEEPINETEDAEENQGVSKDNTTDLRDPRVPQFPKSTKGMTEEEKARVKEEKQAYASWNKKKKPTHEVVSKLVNKYINTQSGLADLLNTYGPENARYTRDDIKELEGASEEDFDEVWDRFEESLRGYADYELDLGSRLVCKLAAPLVFAGASDETVKKELMAEIDKAISQSTTKARTKILEYIKESLEYEYSHSWDEEGEEIEGHPGGWSLDRRGFIPGLNLSDGDNDAQTSAIASFASINRYQQDAVLKAIGDPELNKIDRDYLLYAIKTKSKDKALVGKAERAAERANRGETPEHTENQLLNAISNKKHKRDIVEKELKKVLGRLEQNRDKQLDYYTLGASERDLESLNVLSNETKYDLREVELLKSKIKGIDAEAEALVSELNTMAPNAYENLYAPWEDFGTESDIQPRTEEENWRLVVDNHRKLIDEIRESLKETDSLPDNIRDSIRRQRERRLQMALEGFDKFSRESYPKERALERQIEEKQKDLERWKRTRKQRENSEVDKYYSQKDKDSDIAYADGEIERLENELNNLTTQLDELQSVPAQPEPSSEPSEETPTPEPSEPAEKSDALTFDEGPENESLDDNGNIPSESESTAQASGPDEADEGAQEAIEVEPTNETPEDAAMSVGNSVDAAQGDGKEPERESVETLENRVRAYLNGDPEKKAYMGSSGHKPTPRHEHEDLAVLKSASPDSFDYRFAFNRLQATIRNTPPSWRKKDRDEWKDYHAERQIIPFRPDDAESLLSKNMRDFDVNGSRYTTVEEFIKRGLLSKAVPDEMKPIPYDVIFATLLNSNECKEALADMCTALSRKAAYFTPYGNDDDSRNAWYRLRTSLVNACLSNQTDVEPASMTPEESAAREISASVNEPDETEATQEREPGAALRGLSKARREKQGKLSDTGFDKIDVDIDKTREMNAIPENERYAPYRERIQEALKGQTAEERIDALIEIRNSIPLKGGNAPWLPLYREIQSEIDKVKDESDDYVKDPLGRYVRKDATDDVSVPNLDTRRQFTSKDVELARNALQELETIEPRNDEEREQKEAKITNANEVLRRAESERRLREGLARSRSDVENVEEESEPENTNYGNRGEDGYYPIDERRAKSAHEMNSWRDYKENEATNAYRSEVDKARKIASEKKTLLPQKYHDQIDSLLDKYERRLAEWYDKESRINTYEPSMLTGGAGRISPGRKDRQNARRAANMSDYDAINDILHKIKGLGTAGISSDDSDAVQHLKTKLESLQQLQEDMKAANAYRRKHGSWDGYDGPLAVEVRRATESSRPDFHSNFVTSLKDPHDGSFYLTGNSAEIRRIKERIEQLEKIQGANFGDDVPFDGGVVHFNKEANRIQLKFDDKPDAETISKLKSNGFKWSPREKAWQRMLNGNGIYAAKSLGYLPEDYKAKKGEEPAPTAPEPTVSEPDDQTPEDAARAVSAMADETTSQEVETPTTAPEPETASTAPEPVAEETTTAPAPIEKETASPEIDEKPNVTYEEVKDLFTGENGVDSALSFRGTEYRSHVFSPLFHTGILDKQGLGLAGAFIDDLAPKVRLDGKYKGGAKINADNLRERVIKPFARLLGIEPREGELGPSLLARMKENLESRKSRLLSGNENFNAFMNAKKERESLVAEELKKTIKEIPGADTLGEDKINEIVRDHVNSGFTEIDRGYVEDAIKEKKRISGLYGVWQKEMDAGNFPSFDDIEREDSYFFHDCNHDTACFIGSAYDQYGGRNRRDNLYAANMSRNSELLSNSASAKKAYALAHARGQSSLKPGFYSHRALDELVRANQRRLNFKEDAPGKWTFKGGSLSYVFDPETSTTHFELQLSQAPCQASLNKLKEGYDKRFRYKDGVWRSPDIQPADKEADERYYAERFQKLGLLPIDFDFTDHCQNGELAQSKPKEENAEFETVDDSNSGIASSFISKDEKTGNGLDKYDGAYVIAGGKDIDNYNAVWRDFETPADGEEFRENNSIDSENLLGFIGMPFFRRESLEGSIERDIAVHEAKERLESFYQGARGARARKALAISYSDAANNCRGVAHMRVADELVAINQKLINFRETKPGVWKFGNMGQLEFRYFPYTGERQMVLSFGGKIRMGNSEGSFNTITTNNLRSMGWKYDKYDKTWTSPYIKNGLDLDRCIRMPLQSIGLLPYYFDYNGHCVNEPKATQDDRPTQYARMTSEDVARMISRAVDRYYAKSV